MRLLAISAFLLGCDAGASTPAVTPAAGSAELAVATPDPGPPPHAIPTPSYVIRDDADFVAKVNVILDRLIAVFQQGGKDCDLVERGIRSFGETNRTMVDSLTRYGKEHPAAEKALQEHIKPRMNDMVAALTPTMTACASHKGLQQALQELSNVQPLQRPR